MTDKRKSNKNNELKGKNQKEIKHFKIKNFNFEIANSSLFWTIEKKYCEFKNIAEMKVETKTIIT